MLEATASAGISYSWRSILKGISLLKEGLIWRIGDGTAVNIWTDAWLSRDGSRQPITLRGQSVLTKVSELIDPHGMKFWFVTIYGKWMQESFYQHH
jgi:hypothetical protein